MGTVVLVHDGGYTLEFVAFDGETVAIVTVPFDDVHHLRLGELADAREPAQT